MNKIAYLHGKNYKLNILHLMGAFILFIGILGIFASIANLYQDWNALTSLDKCYTKAESTVDIYECKDALYKETNIVLVTSQPFPSASQNVSVIFTPLMWLLWWIVVSLFGIFFHNVGSRLVNISLDNCEAKPFHYEGKLRKK